MNKIIDQLFVINNKDYLDALYKIIEHSPSISDKVELTTSQIKMLQMTEPDYLNGRTISHVELDKEDKE